MVERTQTEPDPCHKPGFDQSFERMKCQTLVACLCCHLTCSQVSVDLMMFTINMYLFQTLCLTFFNSLIGISPTFNKKVFHQQEIEDAGFDVERLERVYN